MSNLPPIRRRSDPCTAAPHACSTGISGGSALTLRRQGASATFIPERDRPNVER